MSVTASTKQCRKCGYIVEAVCSHDLTMIKFPDECPRCGAIYAKVDQDLNEASRRNETSRKQSKYTYRSVTIVCIFITGFGIIDYFYSIRTKFTGRIADTGLQSPGSGDMYNLGEQKREATINRTICYYPLRIGSRWEYRVTTVITNNGVVRINTTNKLIIRNTGKRLSGENTVIDQTHETENAIIHIFVFENETGIYVCGTQTFDDVDPYFGITPRAIMRYPVSTGTRWDIESSIHIFDLADDYAIGMPAACSIEGTDETVSVFAGTFNRCVRVKQDRSIKHKEDDKEWFAERSETMLFAPDVGLVKSIDLETCRVSYELKGFGLADRIGNSRTVKRTRTKELTSYNTR